MKNRLFIFGALLLMLIINACKKDEQGQADNSITVKIDGSQWTGDMARANYERTSGITYITTYANDHSKILVLNFEGTTPGTYTFKTDDIITYGMYSLYTNAVHTIYASYFALTPSGQIMITEYDIPNGVISGIFQFDAYDEETHKMTLTNGVINKVKLEPFGK